MTFQINFKDDSRQFNPNFGNTIEIDITKDPYLGPYSIDPTIDGVKLLTKNKHMTENVIINPISRYDVENTSGGNTVYIANK